MDDELTSSHHAPDEIDAKILRALQARNAALRYALGLQCLP